MNHVAEQIAKLKQPCELSFILEGLEMEMKEESKKKASSYGLICGNRKLKFKNRTIDYQSPAIRWHRKGNGRQIKFKNYAWQRVKAYWLVDAHKNTLRQYIDFNSEFVLLHYYRDGLSKADTLENFSMSVAGIFE